jgi:trimeric autotransporter adhesin
MKPYRTFFLATFSLSLVQLTFAQTSATGSSALPRLVRFGGTVKDVNGNPLTGVAGITFALYSEQTGGAPLWLETQNVTADSNGRYTALLGATKPDGSAPLLATIPPHRDRRQSA